MVRPLRETANHAVRYHGSEPAWPRTRFAGAASRLTLLVIAGLCVLFLAPQQARAQEFRATISGTVTDPSGAVVAGAQVTVRETNTGALARAISDSSGQYVVPFLLPGDYTITVKATGFKTLVRTGIGLQAQEHPEINLNLSVGQATQTVTVTAAAPLLDQENGSISTDISTRSVADLPLNGRAPAMLTELSVGVITEAAPQISHPFDNNNMNSWSIGGTPLQSSEVLLDGAPDETLLGSLAFSPSEDSVKEVSVQPFATDASFGHTIGGVLNQVTKSGTNHLHGTLYEFSQASALDSNTYFDDRSIPVTKLPVTHFNQYGLTVGGPVWVPKVYNGRNRLFFFFAWEGLKDSAPSTTTLTVPTPAEREGDFSSLLALGSSYQLYEPNTGTYSSGQVSGRTMVPNNCLTGESTYCSGVPNAGYALNPIALNYLKLYPAPNTLSTEADGGDNYISNAPSVDDYSEEFGRMDYDASTRDHVFFDFRHNYRSQVKEDYFYNNTNGSTLVRENWGSMLDNVYTLNPTTVFDTRLNWTFFYEAHDSPAATYTPTQMGFPGSVESASPYVELPVIKFNGGSFENFNSTASPGYDPTTSYQLFADMTKLIGRQTLKVGFDGRQYRMRIRNYNSSGSPSGLFNFGNDWMTSGTSGTAQPFGGDLASFELGLATTGDDSFDLESEADYRTYYVGAFVQDDWRLNPRLVLNLGVRYDLDTPFAEKFGRTESGFNPAAMNSASVATYDSADTATVNNTTLTVNSSTFNTLGGLTFPNKNGGAPYQIADSAGFWSPRLGFSWNPSWLNGSTVVRGGFGVFVQPQTLLSLGASDNPSSNALTFAAGYSAQTPYTSSTNSYYNDCGDGETATAACPAGDTAFSLGNPYPGGLLSPAGSSAGASTDLGQSIGFLSPVQHDMYSERWDLDVQHELTHNTMVEAIYMGNHALHLDVTEQNINAIQKQYLNTHPYLNENLATAMGTNVPNPFAGLLPLNKSFNGSTTPLTALVTPYPQFGSEAIDEYNETIGQSWFQSGMLHLEQRASHGLTLTANYAFSRLIEQDTRLNDQDNFLERRISPFDHTHHFTAGGTYNLPFGKGEHFDFGGNRLWDEILGGYVINGIYQFESGAPMYFSGDIPLQPGVTLRDIKLEPRNTSPVGSTTPALVNASGVFVTGSGKSCTVSAGQPCDGTAFFNGQYAYHYRTLPQTLSWVREDGYNNLDASILKNFHFTETSYFQLRFETFNTLNHPIFAPPNLTPTSSNFGYITSTTSNSQPRQVQLGGRLVF
ncbi:MAG TPA: carboxypeptidase regulatory-like domain-containing protein [Acidobacteriaceae bacterium]|nr:carboxypeptidase regulatory-like domain-containing protein [Acidobacteriaceae bacterium]